MNIVESRLSCRSTGGLRAVDCHSAVGRPSGDRRREMEAESRGKRTAKISGMWMENRGMSKIIMEYGRKIEE